MSAFRDFVPMARDLLGGRDPQPDPLTEMLELARDPVNEWGNLPATGPTGPRALLPSPRPLGARTERPLPPSPRPGMPPASVVANDPGLGNAMALKARRARMEVTRQWQEEDDQAILTDPRVSNNLRSVYRLVQDMDHTIRQQQATLENLRLHVAHLLDTAVRNPDGMAQLRKHLPKLMGLLQDIGEGSPGRGYREQIATVLSELEYAGMAQAPTTPSFGGANLPGMPTSSPGEGDFFRPYGT